MPCLIFLSAILALRCALADGPSREQGDVNLFFESDVSALPLDDSSFSDDSLLLPDNWAQLALDSDDPSLNQLSPVDQSDNILDGPEPVELAGGANDFCAADADTSIFGKLRARGEPSSCPNSDANPNQLKLPDWLKKTFNDIWLIDEPESPAPPSPPPPMPPRWEGGQKRCPGDYGDYIHHLCCEIRWGPPASILFRYYFFMRRCTQGTKLNDPSSKRLELAMTYSYWIWTMSKI